MDAKKGKNGRFAKPGDRGDDCQKSGISGIKSGYGGSLKGECSKGYDPVNTGWGGNVRR